jgi:hypothetical protein
MVDCILIAASSTAFYLFIPPLCRFMFGDGLVVSSTAQTLVAAGLAFKLLRECLVVHGLVPIQLEKFASAAIGGASIVGCLLIFGAASGGGSGSRILVVVVVVELLISIACIARIFAWRKSNLGDSTSGDI